MIIMCFRIEPTTCFIVSQNIKVRFCCITAVADWWFSITVWTGSRCPLEFLPMCGRLLFTSAVNVAEKCPPLFVLEDAVKPCERSLICSLLTND